jgi:hypothetical protein
MLLVTVTDVERKPEGSSRISCSHAVIFASLRGPASVVAVIISVSHRLGWSLSQSVIVLVSCHLSQLSSRSVMVSVGHGLGWSSCRSSSQSASRLSRLSSWLSAGSSSQSSAERAGQE